MTGNEGDLKGQAIVTQVPLEPMREWFDAGNLVKPHGARKVPPGIYVVLADKGRMVNIVALGGDPNGRYWRVPPAMLKKITVDDAVKEIINA